jgi:hypothetical protein
VSYIGVGSIFTFNFLSELAKREKSSEPKQVEKKKKKSKMYSTTVLDVIEEELS